MESRWYIPPGKTLETTKISDREHALHVTSSAWKGLVSHLDRNRLTAETLEKERAHKHALKEGSDAMTRNWPDSKERSYVRKQEERKAQMEALEEKKLKKYLVLRKEQDEMKEAFMEKVQRTMYFGKAYPKKLNGAMLEAEAIFERGKQLEFKNMIKKHEKEEEMKYANVLKENAEDEIREKEEEKVVAWKTKQELKKIYLQDIEEKKEFIKQQEDSRRMKQILDNENATKEIALQEKYKHEEMLRLRAIKRKQLLEYLNKDHEIKAHLAKEEAEVDEVIKIFAEAKQNIECLRREKDIEIRNQMVSRRIAASKMAEQEQAKNEGEYERLMKQAEEEYARRAEERRLAELEKQARAKKEIEEDRRHHLKLEEKRLQTEKEMKKWQMLNTQKQDAVTKEYLEEKRKKQWEKTLEYRKELLDQIEEQKAYSIVDVDCALACKKFLNERLGQKDKKFFEYAEEVLNYCKERGWTTYPAEKVIEDYKVENSLKDSPEPYCENYKKQNIVQPEKMVNTTPGRMAHYPRSDPNYRRCKCQKEKIIT